MTCPRCGFDNPAGFRFCGQCGTALSTPGEAPPRPPAPASDTARPLPQGERKHVTVLFADVMGSMDLAEPLDPETWHRIIDRFFTILADGVHRFDGTVTQYTGDGIMAIFGAPVAQEDHAQRACHAALYLRDALRRHAAENRQHQQLALTVRMGLNSGNVVAGRVGDDLHMEYTAIGHTVGLAARMEQLAEPGTICLTAHTARLVEGFFSLRDLGSVEVKGVSEPVRHYRLDGIGSLRTRLDLSRTRGLSRFVGRVTELEVLEQALLQAANGQGRVVGIVADPGVGKSRLCFELAQRCRARAIPVFEAQAVAHGRMLPFLPLLGLLRRLFRISAEDTDAEAREKIAGVLVLLDPEFHASLPFWFDFLAVPHPARAAPAMDAAARQQHLTAALRRLIEARADGGPVVVVIEDLQWLDAASESVLGRLIDSLPDTRTLLVVNFRTEYRAGWMEASHYEQLSLSPLGPDAVDALLDGLLGTDPTLADVRHRIQTHTAGNPFFIEEVVRALIDEGLLVGNDDPAKGLRLARPLTTIEIPPTVQAVLAARIDRLPSDVRRVLQTAAVIGKTFAQPILERVMAPTGIAADTRAARAARIDAPSGVWPALRALQDAHFIAEESDRSELTYAFTHPLTQEVAYHSQLTTDRAPIHRAVAGAITERYADMPDRHAALLAYHWERADDPLEAARWHRRAAKWVALTNFTQSVQHWRQVKALADRLLPSPERTELAIDARAEILVLGPRLGLSDEERLVLAEELQHLVRDGEHSRRARAILRYGPPAMQVMRGEAPSAIETLRAALLEAESEDDPALTLAMRSALALAYLYTGLLREALAITEPIVTSPPHDTTLGCDLVGSSPYILLLLVRGICLREVGQPDAAHRALERGIELARQHGELEPLTLLHLAHVDLARMTGNVDPALAHAREAVEAAEKVDSPFSRNQAYSALSRALMLRGEWDAAVRACERALAIVRETRFGLSDEPFRIAALAEAHLQCGEGTLARSLYEQAVSLARLRCNRLAESYAHVGLAASLVVTSGAAARAAIESALACAEALVEQTGGRSLLGIIHLQRAQLGRLLGDNVGADREMHQAYRLFIETGATGHAQRIAPLLRKQ